MRKIVVLESLRYSVLQDLFKTLLSTKIPHTLAKSRVVKSEKVLRLIIIDLSRFVSNPTENLHVKNLPSIFLKDSSVSFDPMIRS